MSEASVPAPAATVSMLRDGDQGLETLMVVRHHEIDFASGALVFPGGRIDVQDSEVSDCCEGVKGWMGSMIQPWRFVWGRFARRSKNQAFFWRDQGAGRNLSAVSAWPSSTSIENR